jgi:hypothetical protein
MIAVFLAVLRSSGQAAGCKQHEVVSAGVNGLPGKLQVSSTAPAKGLQGCEIQVAISRESNSGASFGVDVVTKGTE